MEPLVSVVIPAYNAACFLDLSIQSALSQADVDLEVIVVDDGSTDNTRDRLSGWRDPRLRSIHRANGGCAEALNTGIRAARGSYIAILDADDLWLPGKLARHIAFHRDHPGADATFSWVNVFNREGKLLQVPCPRWRGAVSFSQLLADYVIRTCSAVVMRREAAERAGLFDSRFVRCVDLDFFLRVSLLRPDNIHAIPEVLTLYRRHDKQRTRDWRQMEQGWNQVMASARSREPQQTARVERLATSNTYRYFAGLAYESGDFRGAAGLVRRSFSSAPAGFLRDRRNWIMSAAVLSGLTLPGPVLRFLERAAGFDRAGDDAGRGQSTGFSSR